jgi:apolipoprotein D and lipocalin family protein
MNAASTTLDLEAQIDAAELAVIDRDRRVLQRTRSAMRQVKARTGRSILIGVGAAIAAVLLFRASRRRPGLARAGLGAAAAASVGRHRPLGLTRLAAMAWPLLPSSVRRRISPRAMSLLGVGLPLFAGLAAGARDPAPATAVNFDLPRYAGRWYEIARLPLRQEAQCESDVAATYLLQDEGIAVINQCLRADGTAAVVQGEARMTDPEDPAKLEVSFAPEWLRWLSPVWSDYWVLHVDPDYSSAVVGTPDRRQLWLLSRTPLLGDEQYTRLVEQARHKAFDVGRLVRTPQHT